MAPMPAEPEQQVEQRIRGPGKHHEHEVHRHDDDAEKDFKRCLSLQPSLRSTLDAEITNALGQRAEETSGRSSPLVSRVDVN